LAAVLASVWLTSRRYGAEADPCRLKRSVDSRIEGERLASTACLVGSRPDETPRVELGNGIVSVVEDVVRSTGSTRCHG